MQDYSFTILGFEERKNALDQVTHVIVKVDVEMDEGFNCLADVIYIKDTKSIHMMNFEEAGKVMDDINERLNTARKWKFKRKSYGYKKWLQLKDAFMCRRNEEIRKRIWQSFRIKYITQYGGVI